MALGGKNRARSRGKIVIYWDHLIVDPSKVVLCVERKRE